MGQSLAREAARGILADDLSLGAEVQRLALERRHLQLGSAKRLPQRDAGREAQVAPLPAKEGVRLLAKDEDHVTGPPVGQLVAYAGKGNPGTRLPARTNLDDEHLATSSRPPSE